MVARKQAQNGVDPKKEFMHEKVRSYGAMDAIAQDGEERMQRKQGHVLV